VWFRINVGRANNADPRWLLPTICRLGHVTRREVGTIRIFDRETKFEVARHAAPKFAGAVRKSADESLRIEPTDFHKAGSAGRERPGRGTKPKSAGPRGAPGPSRFPGKGPGKPRGGKPGRAR
jgi:ATP-dependent RNA helicase DeaD